MATNACTVPCCRRCTMKAWRKSWLNGLRHNAIHADLARTHVHHNAIHIERNEHAAPSAAPRRRPAGCMLPTCSIPESSYCLRPYARQSAEHSTDRMRLMAPDLRTPTMQTSALAGKFWIERCCCCCFCCPSQKRSISDSHCFQLDCTASMLAADEACALPPAPAWWAHVPVHATCTGVAVLA